MARSPFRWFTAGQSRAEPCSRLENIANTVPAAIPAGCRQPANELLFSLFAHELPQCLDMLTFRCQCSDRDAYHPASLENCWGEIGAARALDAVDPCERMA